MGCFNSPDGKPVGNMAANLRLACVFFALLGAALADCEGTFNNYSIWMQVRVW